MSIVYSKLLFRFVYQITATSEKNGKSSSKKQSAPSVNFIRRSSEKI